MNWKKTDYDEAKLEEKQRAYIREAMEMAKRSLSKGEAAAAAEKTAETVVEKAEPVAAEAPVEAVIEKAEPAAEVKAEETAKTVVETAPVEEVNAEVETAQEEAFPKEQEEKTEEMLFSEELTRYIPEEEAAEKDCCEEAKEKDVLDVRTELMPKEESSCAEPPNFNQYINNHNRNHCGCPACQAKRQQK